MHISPQKQTSPKTVLILTDEMILGGAALFVLNLCEGLKNLEGGWNGVAGVFFNTSEIVTQMHDRDIPVIGPFENAVLHEDLIEAMHTECVKLKPDAVIANLGGTAFDFMRFVPPGVLRIGMIHSDHESVYNLVKYYSQWLDVVVAVSRHSVDQFNLQCAADHLFVTNLACGIPIAIKARSPRLDRKLKVLYFGRIIEQQKRVGLMARIIRQSLAMSADIEWTIIGDGPQLPEFKSCLGDLAQSVSFHGWLDYVEISKRLPEHDVFFLCSDHEGLPLAMLEAMSAGLVPVVSDLPSGISEVVNEENGIRVEMHDEQGFVNALLTLANSPDLVESMSHNARISVMQEYSIPAMTRRWDDLLDEKFKPVNPTWKLHEPVTLPDSIAKNWFHHPSLRPFRRSLKRLSKSIKRFQHS
jgi:glycosyltransferase involved in cell wall biosynthesis